MSIHKELPDYTKGFKMEKIDSEVEMYIFTMCSEFWWNFLVMEANNLMKTNMVATQFVWVEQESVDVSHCYAT